MPSSERITEFAAVATTGSISAAARTLELQRATLSRRMSALEAELGVLLFHRSTRHLTLTQAGQELGRRARRIAADSDEAWNAVRRMDNVPRGVLRVSTAGDALDDLLIAYVRDFPQVQLEVLETARVVNLVAEGIDVAVRFGPVRDGNLIAKRVGGIRRVLVASPQYLEEHGAPASLADLADHPCIVGFGPDGAPAETWPTHDGKRVAISRRIAQNSLRLARAAARSGLGLALLTKPFVRGDLDAGTLVPLLEDEVGDTVGVSIVFPEREFLDPKVRVFVDRAVPVLKATYGED